MGVTLRVIGWCVALASAANVGWHVTTQTHQVGWRAVTQPERSRGYFVFQHWRDWVAALPDPAIPITVAVPYNTPLAAFYRLPNRAIVLHPAPGPEVTTAENLVRNEPGWVVVTASRFIGNEGNVAARTWLFRGETESTYSIAAYRNLRPGEKSTPVLYRATEHVTAGTTTHELLLRTWTTDRVRLRITNTSNQSRKYRVITPLSADTTGDLVADGSVQIETTLPAGVISEVKIVIDAIVARAGPSTSFVELLP